MVFQYIADSASKRKEGRDVRLRGISVGGVSQGRIRRRQGTQDRWQRSHSQVSALLIGM